MLAKGQNEALTRVSSETPMGKMMRRYWIPALLSWEPVSYTHLTLPTKA